MRTTGILRLVALALPLTLTAAALLLGAACRDAEVQEEEERAAIEAMLQTYLPKLARAYETLDAEVLRPQAVNREVASVQARIDDLGREGRQVRPELRSVTVEELEIERGVNAHVTTHEVWDLRVFALGTDASLSEELGQVNRVRYQLRKEGGRWQVLFREIQSR